jgi:peptidoglycan/LPS O-acetylase OafA/YrhL
LPLACYGLLYLAIDDHDVTHAFYNDVCGHLLCLLALLVKGSWNALIIGFAKRYLSFTSRFLKYTNGIVYPFLILHQTIIIVFGFYVIDWGGSGISEFLIIVVGTFVFCGLITEFVIKRINVLRFVFGLNKIRDQKYFSSENNANSSNA